MGLLNVLKVRTQWRLTMSLRYPEVAVDLCYPSKESKLREMTLYTSIVYSSASISIMLGVSRKAVSQRIVRDDAVVIVALLLTMMP